MGNKDIHTTCFSAQVFDDEKFDPVTFVASSRLLVPLERLRDELQAHLNDRKQELYDLINRDYADFILVSSKLSGVGGKVADLREPMARLLSRASGLREAANLEASRLEAKLEERKSVRERKASIERCLRFLSTLDTAERLLGIEDARADPDDDAEDEMAEGAAGLGAKGRPNWDAQELDEDFDDPDLLEAFPGFSRVKGGDGASKSGDGETSIPSPGPGAKAGGSTEEKLKEEEARVEAECALLERVAHYALMMNADLQTAVEEGVSGIGDASATSLMKSMSSRASRVESEVTRRLRAEFAGLVKPPPLRPVAGSGSAGLTEVPADAEAGAVGGDVAVGGVGDGGADGVEAWGGGRERMRRALLSCLRPFSALGSGIEAEKQFVRAVMQPFLEARFTPGIVDGGERGSSKGLGPLLDELLGYVKEVAGDALVAAEEMLGVPGEEVVESKAGEDQGTIVIAPLPVDLVCNGVWRPVQQVLMTRLSSIFATGMVSVQRTNYTLCMGFLEGLSAVCGEEKRPHVRRRLLAQDTVAEFKARWNLPIYFQLRSRGITARLDAALEAAQRLGGAGGELLVGEMGAEEEGSYAGPAFDLPVFREVWRCLDLCWDPEVFLPCVSHRFLRLSLQCIARIGAWAGSREVHALPADDIVPISSGLDKLLHSLRADYVETAARRLSAPAAGERHRDGRGAFEGAEARELVGDAVQEAVGSWGPLIDTLWEKATSLVAEQCTTKLQAVKGITAIYRMTNKPAPQRPSPFVPNVLRDLREFDQKWGDSEPRKEKPVDDEGVAEEGWKDRVVLAVCSRYLEIVSELLLTVRQMENTLNKRRVTGRRGARLSAADQGPSDKDKIMMQLRLDVNEFGREAATLGVDLSAKEPYVRLLHVVEASSEGSNQDTTLKR